MLEVLIKKKTDTKGLVTTIVLNTNFCEVVNKIPDTSGSVTTTILKNKN